MANDCDANYFKSYINSFCIFDNKEKEISQICLVMLASSFMMFDIYLWKQAQK